MLVKTRGQFVDFQMSGSDACSQNPDINRLELTSSESDMTIGVIRLDKKLIFNFFVNYSFF